MGRFFLALAVGSVVAAGVAYQFNLLGLPSTTVAPIKNNSGKDVTKPNFGNDLYAAAKDEAALRPEGPGRLFDPILITAQLGGDNKLELASQLEGQLLFVGEEVPVAAQLVAGVAPFLPDPCNIAKVRFQDVELIPLPDGTSKRRFVDRDDIRVYRRLIKGQTVDMEQMLAMLNPAKAMTDKRLKIAKLQSAEADYRAANETTGEAKANYNRLLALPPSSRSEYDLAVARVTWSRAKEEATSKFEAIKSATAELEQAQLMVRFHEIPNNLAGKYGVIKDVFRDRGEAVKQQDKIMELLSLETFWADGLLDAQYLKHVKEGMRVLIEPTEEESRLKIFKAHRAEITGVAFTNDAVNPLIVSASEDRTIRVWDRKHEIPIHYFPHDDPVRAVACSPPGAEHNLILSGCSDGSIYLWDLADPSHTPQRIAARERGHHDAVTCLAISPDGKYFASGSADHGIKVWDLDAFRKGADKGDLLYSLDAEHGAPHAHNGAITSLHFTPQCRLVSASRDNTIRVWTLKETGVDPVGNPVGGRNGAVSQLGVSDDGRFMLYDQGKSLQVLSVADGRTLYTVQSPGQQMSFETLAVFSPDASLLLTGGAAEGRLVLWSAPGPDSRGYEIRQLVADEHSPVTCAAFAPRKPASHDKGSLAASGTKDGYVYLWPIPSADEVKNHPIRNVQLTTINSAVDPTTKQIGIRVAVRNQFSAQYPNGRLIPGRPVTIVIQP